MTEQTQIQTIGIDGDPLIYKIGFAGEETKHVEIKGNGANFYPIVVPEQTRFSQTLAFPRSAGEVEFLMNTYIANLKQRLKCNNVEIWLSGSKNFRSRLATVMKYKGNRDKKRRPYYYDHLREFLCRHHGAQVVEGIEAVPERYR